MLKKKRKRSCLVTENQKRIQIFLPPIYHTLISFVRKIIFSHIRDRSIRTLQGIRERLEGKNKKERRKYDEWYGTK